MKQRAVVRIRLVHLAPTLPGLGTHTTAPMCKMAKVAGSKEEPKKERSKVSTILLRQSLSTPNKSPVACNSERNPGFYLSFFLGNLGYCAVDSIFFHI